MSATTLLSAALAAVLLTACGSARLTPSLPIEGGWAPLPAMCAAEGTDSDGDGLTDECELNLATAFAPVLMQSSTRCTPPPARPRSGIPGGYLHAVQRVGGAIRLVYMPAYYRDCGWSGAKCILADCAPHAGDSEIIAIDLLPRAGSLAVGRIFLSAHCFGRIRSDCRWYEGEELAAFAWTESEPAAPVVWVADGRHANYPSRAACERGHLRFDTCEGTALAFRFPVVPARNVGSRERPIRELERRAGCVSGAWIEPGELLLVGPEEVECFWDPEWRFRGWQGAGEGVTAYGRYLEVLGL